MYWIDANNPDMRGGCRSFNADTVADVANLPTSTSLGVKQGDDDTSCQKVAKGSSCLVLGSSQYFKLNSEDQWVEL
jgi:hypothetical protein